MSTRPRILVIDDDPLFRGLLVSTLRKDFIVAVAKEGSEGYYKALECRPDVVIVDVKMPGWDGLRTVRAFRTHQSTAQCRIMMLTGDASRETVVSAIRSGADDYLIKTSFTTRELREKLQTLLDCDQVSAATRTVPAATDGLDRGTSAPATPTVDEASPARASEPTREPTPETTDTDLQHVLDGWE